MLFEVSGVEVAWWVPPLAAFGIASVFSTGGVSGAFILLPFQVSVLGFNTPAVTATNHLYNVVAIPGGVYRYMREGRMLWPLTAVILAGTLPGVVAGTWIRVTLLPDPRAFKLFVGCVLLVIGGRLAWESVVRPALVLLRLRRRPAAEAAPEVTEVEVTGFSWRNIAYRFAGREFRVASPWLFLLSAAVGIVGGAYGVGGGAFIAPVLVSFFGLPVYTIAGAALMGTCVTSLFGVLLFALVAPLMGSPDLAVTPDWVLGCLFGLGGLCGTYVGARLQRHVPQDVIRVILAVGVVSVAARYVVGYFG